MKLHALQALIVYTLLQVNDEESRAVNNSSLLCATTQVRFSKSIELVHEVDHADLY
jgi:hypothetical protein